MTIKELIEELKKYPEDLEVHFFNDEYGMNELVESVIVEEEKRDSSTRKIIVLMNH